MSGAQPITNPVDPETIIFTLTKWVYGSEANDGLVGTCSSHFGSVIRDDYAHNHTDETNMILGLRGVFSPDPVELYRQHANRLKAGSL